MAKKIFLTRQRAIPTTDFPHVSAGRRESEAGPSSGNTLSRMADELTFMILDGTTKLFQNLMRPGVVC
jgi:hypothetical protein